MTDTPPDFRHQSTVLREIFTVSRLNETARALLERELGMVWVEGEISNLARPASGHIYFSLKDRGAQIRCAMFRRRGPATKVAVQDGMSVLAYGRVSVYTARGDYQLIVEALEAAGEGLLRQRFEELKRRLDEEGLFDATRKQPLPAWPRAIGVVTSASGAALHDILTVLKRRCAAIPVIVYPTAVQGEGAAAEIAAAIACANRRAECDVLIVGRGGGSLEDLWAFNEERVARAIDASRIPIVSAVGHEVDFTIADLVADVRAATPSAAAELVSPDVAALRQRLDEVERRLALDLRRAMSARSRQLDQLWVRLRQVSPRRRLEQHFQRLDELSQRLPLAMATRLELAQGRLAGLRARIQACAPARELRARHTALDHLRHRLRAAVELALAQRRQALGRAAAVLRAVGPQATLERGYAIVTTASGQVLRRVDDIARGETVTTRLAQGRFDSTVTALHDPAAPRRDDDQA